MTQTKHTTARAKIEGTTLDATNFRDYAAAAVEEAAARGEGRWDLDEMARAAMAVKP